MFDPKPRPNDGLYHELMRRLTPAQRVEKTMELCGVSRRLFFAALRRLHPGASESEIKRIALERLYGWSSQNSSST